MGKKNLAEASYRVKFFGISILGCLRHVHGSISVGGIRFDSMPAVFGRPWVSNVEYVAQLKYMPSNLLMCEAGYGHSNIRLLGDPPLLNVTAIVEVEESPDHTPVALLISRGGCSFEEKARIAMTFPNVAYAVIFDDRERSRLVPMSAGNAAGIDIGLMFIARESGLKLKKMIDQQARNATSNDVLLVSMDSVVPDYAYDQEYSDAQEWVLAAMSSFFAFLSCIGCLLVCAQAGFIPSENGRPAIFGGGELLLTEEEVLQLPVVDYDTRDDPTHQTSCAICLEDFEEGDKLRQLPCRHHFHTECVTPWLTERHSSCPLCKYQVNSIDDSETSLQSRWSAMFLYGSIVRMIPYNSRRTLVATDDLDQIRGENRADLTEGNFLDDGGAETV